MPFPPFFSPTWPVSQDHTLFPPSVGPLILTINFSFSARTSHYRAIVAPTVKENPTMLLICAFLHPPRSVSAALRKETWSLPPSPSPVLSVSLEPTTVVPSEQLFSRSPDALVQSPLMELRLHSMAACTLRVLTPPSLLASRTSARWVCSASWAGHLPRPLWAEASRTQPSSLLLWSPYGP